MGDLRKFQLPTSSLLTCRGSRRSSAASSDESIRFMNDWMRVTDALQRLALEKPTMATEFVAAAHDWIAELIALP